VSVYITARRRYGWRRNCARASALANNREDIVAANETDPAGQGTAPTSRLGSILGGLALLAIGVGFLYVELWVANIEKINLQALGLGALMAGGGAVWLWTAVFPGKPNPK
jgi:hypothetical protein